MGSIYMAGETPTKYIGKCIPCNRPVAFPLDAGRSIHPSTDVKRCPDCGQLCDVELMYGVVNRMVCDDRCMGAYGPNCVCGCGGVNHGGIWIEVLENIPAHVIDAYHKDQEKRRQAAETKAKKKYLAQAHEFDEWASHNIFDVSVVKKYDGDNHFVVEAKSKLENNVIMSDNYLSAVLRVIDEEKEKQRKEQAALKSEYQAVIDATIVRTLTITDIIHIKDNYAFVPRGHDIPTKPLYKFTDPDGNVYAWFASKYQVKVRPDGTFGVNDGWSVGDTFKVTAKVKKHEEYKGVKQTVISYVKVVK